MPEFREITRPYPGLRPFESWEGEIFFGREEHTNRLLDILQQQRFLAVIGPSGSGKSSLVRAGLLPALPLGSLGTGSDWRIALMRPGNRPMQRLAQTLLGRPALGIELVGAERIPRNERQLTPDVALIEAELRRGPLGLIDVVKDARTQESGDEPFNLLVLVDQFEELFTYAEAGGRRADESEAFVNLLLASKSAPDPRIYIALTMRTDFLGNCVRFLELPDAINRAQYLTPRLTREQIERAITGPAHMFDGEVEPTLVAELINAVSNDPDQLPILAHALARMWELARRRAADPIHITWEDFNAVGGINAALSRHANDVLASLSSRNEIEEPLSAEQGAAEILFRAITGQRTAEAGGQAVRRPQSLDRIAAWSGRKWQDFVPVVRAFADQDVNFLNYTGELSAETVIDISHEALIRQWGRLREWVTEEARLAAEYRRWRDRAEDKAAGTGALLTGADLVRAVEWRLGYGLNRQASWKPRPEWASRYGSASGEQSESEFSDVLRFIDESQQVVLRAETRERRLKWTMIGLTVLSLSAMTIAIYNAVQVDRQLIATEASALWHPLDFSGDSVNKEQGNGLLALTRAGGAQKNAFLEQLLTDASLAAWFNHQPDAILRAAVGMNLERRSWFIERLVEIPPEKDTKDVFRVARALSLLQLDGKPTPEGLIAAIKVPQSFDQLDALSQGLTACAGKVPEGQTGAVADKFLAAIQAAENPYVLRALGQGLAALPGKLTEAQADAVADKFLAAIQAAEDQLRRRALCEGLAALAVKLTEAQAGAVADKFLAAIQAAKDDNRRGALGEGLAALAVKLTEVQAGAVADMFLAAKNHSQLRALGQGLAALPVKLTEAQADAVAEKFVAEIQQATKDHEFLRDLIQGLVALPVKLTEAQADAVADTFVLAAKHPFGLQALGEGVAALAVKLTDAQAGALADKFLAAIQADQNRGQLTALAVGLAALAVKLTEAQVGTVADKFLAVIQATDAPYLLVGFGHSLAALPGKLTEAQADAVVDKFLAAIQAAQDEFQLAALGPGLAALAGKLTEAQAGAVVDKFLAAIQAEQDEFQLAALGPGLAALPGRLTEAQADAVVDKFLAAIRASDAPYRLRGLGQGLAAVAGYTSDDDQVASLLFELLKAPLIPRDTITDAIRKRFPEAPPKEQGFWALIEWADKRFPDLDLEAPLPPPPEVAASNNR